MLSLSPDALLPVKASLLLRLGETRLANQLWTTWLAGMDAGINDDAIHLREAVLRGLADKTVVGALTPRPASPTNKYDLKIENATAAAVVGGRQMAGTVIGVARSDPQPPSLPLVPTTFRVCDVYALKLRGFEGAPAMQLYWSEPQRDAAVNSMSDFLRNHSAKFVYSAERDYKYTQ